MRPTGAIPPAPAFYLERDCLAQVLCQVRFPPLLRLRTEESVAAFQDVIRGQYPQYQRQEGHTVVVSPQGIQTQPDVSVRHLFGDPETKHTVILSTDFVAVDSRDYLGIEDFAERVRLIVDSVAAHFTPGAIERIGLRFINEFHLPSQNAGTEMRRAIAPQLLGAPGAEELDGVVQGGQQVMELAGTDGQLLVRHGLSPVGGSTVEASPFDKAPQVGNQDPYYLLDLDAYKETAIPFSAAGVDSTLRTFNDDIRTFFTWGVRDEYRRNNLAQRDTK